MPVTIVETYDESRILQPVQQPADARQDAVRFGASLTILRGTALGIKTADGLAYAMVPGATDGTQNFIGFCMYDIMTDASSSVFYAASTTPNVRTGPWTTAPIWKSGIFNPVELQTKGSLAGETRTFSFTNVTAADVFTLKSAGGPGAPQTIAYTAVGTTAAEVVGGLGSLWKANPTLVALGATSGTSTFIVNGATGGNSNVGSVMGLTLTAVTATVANANTVAASGRSLADILVGRPGAYVLQNGFWCV